MVAVEGRVIRRQKSNPEIPTGEVEVVGLAPAHSEQFEDAALSDRRRSDGERGDAPALPLSRSAAPASAPQSSSCGIAWFFEIRKTLDEMGFFEIETPMLTRSTPEGARDYLVPSRVHHGQFYALPQSPQIFKQILMISGMDRYFQIVQVFPRRGFARRPPAGIHAARPGNVVSAPAGCFRGDRASDGARCAVVGVQAKGPFRHLDYKEALRRYGSDKPDLRFGMELHNVTEFFEPARAVLHFEGNVQAVVASGAAAWSRKQLDELGEFAKSAGARGVYTVKVTAEGISSPLEKNLGADGLKKLAEAVGAKARRPDCRDGGQGTDSSLGQFAACGRADSPLPRRQTEFDRPQQMGVCVDYRLRAF